MIGFYGTGNTVVQLDHHQPVPAQRYLYLQRTAVVRKDETDHTWYVVHRMNGQRVVTRQHLPTWDVAMASALHWVGLT